MSELTSLSVREMQSGLAAGDFSAAELTEAHLQRIHETNETFNSFISICDERARAQAAAVDQKRQENPAQLGALAGIPLAVKDMLVTKGVETTAASKMLKGFIPPYTCTAVQRLEDAGAIVLGKTNLDEFAMGASNEHSAFGPARNPWNPDRVPGGSSGGSAAAVALGQAAISLGTDTGGSIRQPAGFSGVVGLKPTYGRVSRHGAIAFASSLDQIGPFGRSCEDVAAVLEAIAGSDERDSTSMNEAVPAYSSLLQDQDASALKGLRVGIPKEYFIEGLESDVEAAIRSTMQTLSEAGATLVDISLPHTEHALAVYYIVNPAEASSNLARYDGVRFGHRSSEARNLRELYEKSRAEGFGSEVQRRILIGTFVLSTGYFDAYYRKAQQVRTLIIKDFTAAFQNHCDVILTPTSPTTAFPIGDRTADPVSMYLADVFTVPVNLAGLPGLSLPCGLDSAGLPIGLQLIGPAFSEAKLLGTGKAIESLLSFDTRTHARS